MTEASLRATNGPYCGGGCPAWGMWDLDLAWCDVFEMKLSIKQGSGTYRCVQCLQLSEKGQEAWYAAFSKWREAVRKQDDDDKAAGKKTGRYLRKEYRDRADAESKSGTARGEGRPPHPVRG